MTAKMISEGRMDGSIDQISGVVHFKCKIKNSVHYFHNDNSLNMWTTLVVNVILHASLLF